MNSPRVGWANYETCASQLESRCHTTEYGSSLITHCPHYQLPLAWTPCKSVASFAASPPFTINPQHTCAIEFHLKGRFTFGFEALSCELVGYQTLRLLFTEAHTRPSHPGCMYIFHFCCHWLVNGWLLSLTKQIATGCRFEWEEAHLPLLLIVDICLWTTKSTESTAILTDKKQTFQTI